MEPVPKRRGGYREGAGRKKKRANELQKPHTICATDKDWQLIKSAAHVIKHTTITDYEHTCFLLLPKEDYLRIQEVINDEWLKEWKDAIHGKPPRYVRLHTYMYRDLIESQPEEALPPPLPEKPAITITKPETLDEEEAVSAFLQYYRLNPGDASSVVQAKLDRELQRKKLKEIHETDDRVLARLGERADAVMESVDDVNARIEQLLRFPGYRQPEQSVERKPTNTRRSKAFSKPPIS